MLIGIELENFKGAGQRVRSDLKPISLLFGANSSGNRSVLRALFDLDAVVELRFAHVERTEFGRNVVNLGGFARLLREMCTVACLVA